LGDEWVNHQDSQSARQKIHAGLLDKQYLANLSWKAAKAMLKSRDLRAMMALMDLNTDLHNGTVEELHPLAFMAKANAEDNPNWHQVMNGPNQG